ncbi:DUF1804 family protein [Pseudomonas aeruginosa]|uniref:DUF1804 family protein n=1 Tax=Pseudomonas aeruginosa TaxID=287 RepID=UPI003D6E3B42
MAHPKETRDALRRAYVLDRQYLEVGGRHVRRPYGTRARRWKQQAEAEGDDWDKAQSAQLLAGGGLEDVARQVLAGLVTQFQATMEAIQVDADIKPAVKVQLLASLADAYNKTVSASKRVLPETSALATAMEVLQAWLELHLRERVSGSTPRHSPRCRSRSVESLQRRDRIMLMSPENLAVLADMTVRLLELRERMQVPGCRGQRADIPS